MTTRPDPSSPSSAAIARAVSGWSPVIITGLMPARAQVRIASFASGRGGSIIPTRPRSVISLSALSELRVGPTGDGEDAKRLGGELLRGFQHGLTVRLAERAPRLAGESQREQERSRTSGAPLEYATQPSGVSCSVVIRFRSEVNAISATRGRAAIELVPLDPRLRRRDDQRRLGRIAADLRASVRCAHEPCVGSECGGAEELAQRLRRGDRLAVAEELALGLVAAAGDVERLPGDPDAADGHLVGRERAGLVAADHRDAAERLDRRAAGERARFASPSAARRARARW